MKVKSKYNINDKIHYMDNNTPCVGTIEGIEFFVGKKSCRDGSLFGILDNKVGVKYCPIGTSSSIEEKDVYPTKEALQIAVFKNQKPTTR